MSKYDSLLRMARDSLASADRILNERQTPLDWHAVQAAASQAQQAASELRELLGYIQGFDDGKKA